jgi:hypothetical protein
MIVGRPGSSWSLVTAPIYQNGIARANTNKKNCRGDQLHKAMVFEESSSTDWEWRHLPLLLSVIHDANSTGGNCTASSEACSTANPCACLGQRQIAVPRCR